jgi:hypothetical protein
MGYKNKTNIEYQIEYYAKNKVKRNQYHKDYYKANQEYIRIYQYFYYRNKKYEHERDSDVSELVQNEGKTVRAYNYISGLYPL